MAENNNIREEAAAFTRRIAERVSVGFVPDLQNLQDCEYFYKSFWRNAKTANLYVGEMSRYYVKQFTNYLGQGSRILDLGCGPGYFSLELARAGFNVIGLDISDGAVSQARITAQNAGFKDDDIRLQYLIGSDNEIESLGSFDGILCSGVLHHFVDLKKSIRNINSALRPAGIVVMHEPQHKYFKMSDAKLVAIIRLIINSLGHWYDTSENLPTNKLEFDRYISQIHNEYFFERDSNEFDGQSPNDLNWDRDEILAGFGVGFTTLHLEPSFSFIYRMIGGLRGQEHSVDRAMNFLADLDRFLVQSAEINANYYFATLSKN